MVGMIAVSFLFAIVPFAEGEAGSAVERGRRALDALAKKHLEVVSLKADFVQEIRTPLVRKPIVSRGAMVFRRENSCAVFFLKEPRVSQVRFDERSYQVFRPAEKRAERFLFEEGDLTSGLVKIFTPEAAEMEKVFDLKEVVEKDGFLSVSLSPKDKGLTSFLTRLTLVISEKDAGLREIAYANMEGDEVRIKISNMVVNPSLDDDLFRKDPPEGVRLTVRRLEPQ